MRSATSWCAGSTDQGWPGVGYWICGESKQVTIFTTPGTFSASERSKDFTSPLAIVLRTTLATRQFAGRRSSVYLAPPVTFSYASTRVTLFPIPIRQASLRIN